MASLAGLLLGEGYRVSGADENLYPPMSDLIEQLGVGVYQGYGPESLSERPELVVVGNVVTRKFPVAATLKEKKIPYLSFPQTMSELFLEGKKNLVVAGCHGKTTLTNLSAVLFSAGGFSPGFLIGGFSGDFPLPYRKADKEWFIIEGDEYDSAFFNKVPKFVHYKPHTVILTSVEYDHADIYPDLNSVVKAYESLMRLIPKDGLVIAGGYDPLTRKVALRAGCPVLFYGETRDDDWRVGGYRTDGLSSTFTVTGPRGFEIELSWRKTGLYNALGAAAAVAAYAAAGGDKSFLPRAFEGFVGPKRRQELIFDSEGIILIDDFAHHPTAVLKTLGGLREAFPDRRILAVFEPRSNTTRRAVFQKEYAESFKAADRVYLSRVNMPEKAPPGDRLDLARLKEDIGVEKTVILDSPAEIAKGLLGELKRGDVILVMSNGDFGGLVSLLKNSLKAAD
jgi:UDP-N-acetylmuramate: L-alanyl-gamma-D-glutamyl-meso-diaminopimelate ligase